MSGWGPAAGMSLHPVAALDLRLEAGGWPELAGRAGDIAAHFACRQKENPALWNGPVLLMRRQFRLSQGVLSGRFRQSDFATFLWWRDAGWQDLGFVNAFSLAAMEGSDGGFVLGVMGAHTSMAGRIYFPGGTPDPGDVTADGSVDLTGSVFRELEEETSLTAADVAVDDGFTAVCDGPRVALLRRLVFAVPAEALARRIRGFLASEDRPELADVAVVRGEADLTDRIAPFAVAYMRQRWGG